MADSTTASPQDNMDMDDSVARSTPANPAGDGAGANSPALPQLTDEEKTAQWLKQNYLTYAFRDGNEVPLTMEDFINIADLLDPQCYIDGNPLSIALALTVKKHERSDIVILSGTPMQYLYVLGIGQYSLEDFRSFHTGAYNCILDPTNRWIVMACSDGVLQAGLQEEERRQEVEKNKQNAEQNNEENAKKNVERPTSNDVQPEGVGNNTATPAIVHVENGPTEGNDELVEDVTEQARKSSTDAKTTSNKEKKPGDVVKPGTTPYGLHWGMLIVDKQTHIAHWVDSLVTMDYVRNKLKIIEMHRAGEIAGKVLCGIDAVLSMQGNYEKGKFNACTLKYVPQQNLHNFSPGDKGACGPFVFAFLEHLFANPEKMEAMKASFPRSRRNQIYFNSVNQRAEIQRLIEREVADPQTMIPFRLTIELLHLLKIIPVRHLASCVWNLQAGGNASRFPRRGGKNGGDQGDDSDGDDGDKSNHPHWADWLRAIGDGVLESKGITSFDQYLAYIGAQKKGEKGTAKENEKNKKKAAEGKTKVVIDNVTYDIPNSDQEVWKAPSKTKANMPKDTKDLPNFNKLKDFVLETWLDVNEDIRTEQEKRGSKCNHMTWKALLHMKFKKTFIRETNDNLKDWVHDMSIFNDEDRRSNLSPDQIKYRLMASYESKTLRHIKKYAVKANNSENAAGDADGQKPERDSRWPPGVIGLPNFLSLNKAGLAKWKASNSDLFSGPKAPHHNEWTERVILHKTFVGTFQKTTAEDRRNYLTRDMSVFHDVDTETLSDKQILDMLRQRYETIGLEHEKRALELEKKNKLNKKKGGPFEPLNIHGKRKKPEDEPAKKRGNKRKR